MLISLLILPMLACDSGSSNVGTKPTEDKSGVSLPSELKTTLLTEGTLNAYIIVDDGARQKMTINGDNAGINLSGLTEGMHSFSIEFEYIVTANSNTPLMLARVTQELNVGVGNNTLSVDEAAYDTSYDDDNDGFSNILEISAGTDAKDDSDMPPHLVFVSDDNINVLENTTVIGYVAVATDIDDDVLSFSLTGGVDRSLFSIDSKSGVLGFNSASDFESPADNNADNIYIVEISVSDGSNILAKTVRVTVIDVKGSPAYTSTSIFEVSENQLNTGYIATAVDDDGDTIIYSLTEGTDNSLFSIDSESGELSFNVAPDYEAPVDDNQDNSYEIVIDATDGTTVVSKSVAIKVNNINDNQPVFISANNAFVAENSIVTGYVAMATDVDSDAIVYSLGLSNETDQALFTINNASGILDFKVAADFEVPLDIDKNNSYVVNIVAYDGVNSIEQTIIITVTDVSEITPEFIVSPINQNTSESGGVAQFSVKLSTQPTANVEINIISSNQAEGIVDKSSISFTPANWSNSKIVTVTGIDDNVFDGNQNYKINLSTAVSNDPNYNGLLPGDVNVINVDNDSTIGGTVAGLAEGGELALSFSATSEFKITKNGSFTFDDALEIGSDFVVRVKVQPDNQNCVLSNSSGVLPDIGISDITVTCSDAFVGGFFKGQPRSVTVQGNYAYIAAEGILKILDVSDKTNPLEVSYVDVPGEALEVAVQGEFAYIAAGGAGLQIVNISNPLKPFKVGSLTSTSNPGFSHIKVSGNYAYAAGSNGLRIIDISDPKSPTLIGKYVIREFTNRIIINSGFAYLVDKTGLHIIDITNPALPVQIGFFQTSVPSGGGVSSGSGDAAISGNYAYLSASNEGMIIVDISVPTNPVEVAIFDDAQFSVRDLILNGNLLYVRENSGAINIFDITQPTMPVRVGPISLSEYINDVLTVISLDTIFVEGNYLYATTFRQGMYIFDISNPAANINDIIPLPHLSYYDASIGSTNDIKVVGGLSYVLTPYDLRVVDISQQSKPVELGLTALKGNPVEVKIVGNRAYVASGQGGLRIIDITNPTALVETGFYDTPGFALAVTVNGNYAYVADWESGLRIIDISNPVPVEVSFIGIPDEGAIDVAVDGDYAFVTAGQSLRVIDISNPLLPVEVAFYDITSAAINTRSTAYKIVISNQYAYVLDRADGLRVFDISDPTLPVETVLFDSFRYQGAVDIEIQDNYAYIASDSYGGFEGLYVIDFRNISSPLRVGFYNAFNRAVGIVVFGESVYMADQGSGMTIFKVMLP